MARSIDRTQPTGLAAYVVVGAIGSELLGLGQSVIVDAVNDAREARQHWVDLADRHRASLRFIEVICSDVAVHRRRLEAYDRAADDVRRPTWSSVQARRSNFELWDQDRLVLDSIEPTHQNLQKAIDYIRRAA